MVRKLLKRKLKISTKKKLKTIKRTKTCLGEWATKQLTQVQKKQFVMRYAKKKLPGLFLQEKQRLNQIVGSVSYLQVPLNFSHKTNGNNEVTRSQNIKTPTQISTHQRCVTTNHRDITEKKDLHKHEIHRIWPLYRLRSKTMRNNSNALTNWNNIYSLDQLMCHQYDAQFRRKISKYKAHLLENRKVRALYGNKWNSKLFKCMQNNKTSPRKTIVIPHLLESRLDVALKRCFVFVTLRSAQHWISQGRILVNQNTITSPSHLLQPGDLFSIAKKYRCSYKTLVLNTFYKYPKESKYVQSGKLLSRWKEWAYLYNYLGAWRQRAAPNSTGKESPPLSVVKSKTHHVTHLRSAQRQVNVLSSHKKLETLVPWPDKGIRTFWYLSGRYPFKCLYDQNKFLHEKTKTYNALTHWLSRQRWPRMQKRYTHWKSIYRRRIIVFSRWLLGAKPLIRDGLYFLRWHRGFIRKKSLHVKRALRQISLQKPLHFEVSHKNFCALYLYPPQRIVWPCMIDFTKVS